MPQDEEEKKKREEEARAIISNSGIGSSINSINYANMKGMQISARNENEQNFINKVNEANSIINSINPRQNVPAPSATDEEIEQGHQNVQGLLDLMNNNIDTKSEDTTIIEQEQSEQNNDNIASEQQREAVNVMLNGNKHSKLLTNQEKEQQELTKQQAIQNAEEANSDTSILSQIGKNIENLWLGSVSGVKEFVRYLTNPNHTSTQEADLSSGIENNKNIPKEVTTSYKAEKNQENSQMVINAQERKTPLIKLYLDKEDEQKANDNILLNTETAKNLDSSVNEYKDSRGELELNPIQRELSKSIANDQTKIASNINQISNPILKKTAELLPSTGNSLTGATLSLVNPYLGMSYFIISASGSYETDGRNRGMSKEEARAYGSIMGFAEGATEMIGIDKFLKAGSSLRKGAFREALKNYGLDMADNAIQESVIDPIDELTAAITSGKTKNDYSKKESWEQLGKDMIQDGIDGALSSLLMNGIGVSIDSSNYLYNKIRNNPNSITEQDVINAYTDIQNNPDINVEEHFKNSFEYQKEKLSTDNNIYSIVNTDEQGNVNLVQAMGEKIPFNNNDININPVVVYDNELGYYNVIDGDTGTRLDTTPYSSKQEAINSFNDKINNVDNATINTINNSVAKTKIALVNKANEIDNNGQNAANQFFVRTSDNQVYSTEDLRNMSQSNTQIREYTREQFDNITKTINQISDDSVYNSTAANRVFDTVSNNIKNVEVVEQSGNRYINSLNDDGRVAYQQKLNNRPYTGKKIKSIVNTAIQNADTTNLYQDTNTNNTQTSHEPKESNFYSNSTNYAVQDINKVTEPFSKQESYSKDEMAEVWNNEVSDNNYDAYYDSNGNIERYIAIEEEGNNIVVNQYDNNDNLIRSATIPNDNGRYNSNDIKDTILKISSNTDLSPYIQEMAANFEDDLNNTLPGERYKTGDTWTGQKRATTKELAEIKDETGASWNKISEVLDDIANGRNNNTKLARTIENKLDNALSEGYTNIYGQTVSPNEEYLEQKGKVYGRSFNTQTNDDYDPTENMTDEDFRIFGMKKQNKKSNTESNEVKSMKKNNNGKNTNVSKNITKQLHNKIQNAVSNKQSRGKTNLGVVSTKVANRIKKITGIEVNNRKQVLLDNDIRHMLNQHSDKIKEAKKGQIAITSKDIERIPDIINNYDRIVKGSINTKGEQSVRYIKRINNTRNYVVEIVPKDNNNLIIKTMWIKPVRVTNGQQTPNLTSKTKPNNGNTTSSNNSITQKTKSVKNTIISKSMQNNKNNTAKAINSLNDIKTKYKNQTDQLNIFENKDNTISINNLVVKQNLRNKGIGQNILNDIIDYADKNSKTITLTPTSQYLTKNRLTNWYKKNGFVENKGRNTNYSISDTMYRLPKTSNDDGVRAMKKNTSQNNTTQNNTSHTDNQGRTLSKQQQEYFKNSKIRDSKGNLQTVYHTSKNDFTVFDPTKTEHYRFGKNNVNYYTDNKNMSLSYSLENPKLYEGYLNITNPYVINAHGAEWNKVNKTFDKTLIDKINKITSSLKQEIISKAQETSQAREKMWNDYQNEVDKIYSLKNKITPSDKFYRVDELENLINKKVSSQRTSDEKEYLTLRKRSEQLYSNYNNYDETAEFYKYFENNKEFDNIVNSLSYEQKDELKTVSRNEFYEIAKLRFNQENIADRFGYYETTNDIVFNVLEENKSRKQKYDGVIIKNVVDYGNYSTYDGEGDVFVTFNSNQFKNVDNTNPTSNQDIRFAKKTAKTPKVEGEILEPGQTNAQRESNYIEQEIRNIEQTGNWDDSIPVTKMTNIRKTIEDYLGIGVQKGRFRQQAYGIYKGNRDVIRTKELKDMDTILHETGHALDIAKRINLNKEAISDELLKAVSNYGGYEAETRDVQLEEGFAEVIREYTIVPNQARIDYPQTVAVLEGIRQTDKDFNKFITDVQQQTYNYIHQNPRNRGGLSNQSIGERTDKPVWSKEYIRQITVEYAFDSNYALKRATQVLQQKSGSKELRASENAYLVTRLISGIGDKVTSMLSDGYIDENGNKLFPGLNQLGEILNSDAERFNDLRAYLVARRHMDYVGKSLKTGIRTNDARAIIEQFQNDTQIQEAAKVIYDTLDGVLQYAVNNKLITEENAQALKESNAFYVPMQRVIGTNGNNVGRKGAVADIIKARTGSELDIKDVLENIVTNSANIIQQVENNRVINALYTQGENAGLTGAVYDEIDPPMKKVGVARLSMWENELKNQGVDIENIDFDKTMDIFIPNNNIDERQQIVSFIDNRGKRRYLQFHDEILFKELTGLDRESTGWFLNLCNTFNKPLRYGATLANLGFALPNMISDTVQASIYSEAGFIPLVDTALGAIDVLTGQSKMFRNFMNKVAPEYVERINKTYALYLQSGSTSATKIGQERKSAQSIMKDIYGTKNSKTLRIDDKMAPLKRLLDIMTYIPELSEQSTRFRVFEKNLEYYRRNGMDEIDARMEAAIQSRDATQDFSRMGKAMREVNKVIPFSAARVGSIYTFAEKMKANPKRTSARIAVLLAVNMVLKSLTSDDDEIQELNQRKKDDNFVFKIGDQVITIKKPQGFLRSLINLTDYIHDLASGNIEEGKEGERLVNWLTNAIMDNSIADDVTGMVPSAITPLLENAINKDLYYNSDIVKSYDLDLPDSEQYYDYNSQLAIWLGKVFNYSPAKIDNFISGYFAGLGTQVTNVIDWIVGKTGATPEEPNMGLEGNSIGKRFFVNVNSNSASVDEVYTLKTDLTKKQNGGTITEEEEKQLEAATEATSNMTKINKQIKEIKKSLTLSADEKAEQIRVLQQQKTDTARQALGKDLLYSNNSEAVESTQFYPSRDTLSQNKRTLTLTSEMKKEYEEKAYEYYQKYEKQGLYSDEKLEQIKEKAKDYAKSYMMNKYKSELVKSN